jgi:hypothetical protein
MLDEGWVTQRSYAPEDAHEWEIRPRWHIDSLRHPFRMRRRERQQLQPQQYAAFGQYRGYAG